MGWRSAMGQAAFGIPGSRQGYGIQPTGPAQVDPAWQGASAAAATGGMPAGFRDAASAYTQGAPGMQAANAAGGMPSQYAPQTGTGWQAAAAAQTPAGGALGGWSAYAAPAAADPSAVGPVIAQAIGPAGQQSPTQYSAADISGYIKQQGFVDANGNVTNPQGIYDASLKYGVQPGQIDGAMGWGAGTSQNWIDQSSGMNQAAAGGINQARTPVNANPVGGYIAQAMQGYGGINPVLKYPRY